MPDTPVAIDEAVVEEEDGVAGRGIDVRHDGSDTVVAPGMTPALGAGLVVGIVGASLADVDVGLGTVGCVAVVVVSSETVGGVARARADVQRQEGKLLHTRLASREGCISLTGRKGRTDAIGNAIAVDLDGAKVLVGEDGRGSVVACVARLVEPRQVAGIAAHGAQLVLEGPDVVAVPRQELGVAVDVGGELLVDGDEVLVAALGLAEGARGRLAHEALDGRHEGLLARGVEAVPLGADMGAGARGLGGELGWGELRRAILAAVALDGLQLVDGKGVCLGLVELGHGEGWGVLWCCRSGDQDGAGAGGQKAGGKRKTHGDKGCHEKIIKD